MRLKKLILVFFSLGLFINAYSHGSCLVSDSCHYNSHKDSLTSNQAFTPDDQTVFICAGRHAYAYHSDRNCSALSSCTGEIKYTDESYALYTMGRRPCCLCWSNAGPQCKDDRNTGDNPDGGSAPFAEKKAIVNSTIAVTAITLNLLVLSNDVYYSPALSIDSKSIDGKAIAGFAHNVGFRKTFDRAALEYGVVYSSFNYQNSYYINDDLHTYTSQYNYWGFNISFVHNIKSSFIYKHDKVYGGLALSGFNLNNTPGLGFIVGDSYEINNRLKSDFRLFYSQRIFQIQVGIIFNYQKKYIWQRWKEKKQ